MPDVFISYAREDWAFANLLADALTQRGYEVWWDKELVAGQEGFRDVLTRKLQEARALIVIWSPDSANSQWVREEAGDAKHFGKLIATKLPAMEHMQIPLGFREDQTETVTELPRIERALPAKGILPRPELLNPGATAGDETYKDRFASLLEEREKTDGGALSAVLPLVVLLGGMVLGMFGIIGSMLIGIGWVQWSPIEPPQEWLGPKQVGYIPALNWSLTTTLILPMAWALILTARQSMFAVRSAMVSRRMIVTQDFEPITEGDERLAKMWAATQKVTVWCIGTIVALLVAFALLDYFTVVDRIYTDASVSSRLNRVDSAGYPLTHVTMERDWSVAAFLTNRTDHSTTPHWLNRFFAISVYILFAGIGVGGLFAFFVALFGVGMFFMPDVSKRYGMLIVPDIGSQDDRKGFELLGRFFSLTLSITALCLVMAYLMSLQNIYLRVPARNLFEFLTPSVGAAKVALSAGRPGEALDALLGNIFVVPGDSLQSLIAWFIAAFMVIAILGVAYLFLRASALEGRGRLLTELSRLGTARLRRLTPLDAAEIRSRLQAMRTWPLLWPSLNATIIATFLIVIAFVFYKAGIVVMVLALGFVIHNTFQQFQR
jgi:hypothetical protein